MEKTKVYFELLAEEMEKELGDIEKIPETEANKNFKEKMIALIKEKYGSE